MNNRQIHLQ